jgi:hypothetical protein
MKEDDRDNGNRSQSVYVAAIMILVHAESKLARKILKLYIPMRKLGGANRISIPKWKG